MKVFCQAWEGIYQGLHGIESLCVMEVSNDIETAIDEINEWGNVESEELIYSYGLEDEYLSDIGWWGDDEENENEDADITQSFYYENRGWRAFKIREDVDKTVYELDELCYRLGDRLFIEQYCEKETLE